MGAQQGTLMILEFHLNGSLLPLPSGDRSRLEARMCSPTVSLPNPTRELQISKRAWALDRSATTPASSFARDDFARRFAREKSRTSTPSQGEVGMLRGSAMVPLPRITF